MRGPFNMRLSILIVVTLLSTTIQAVNSPVKRHSLLIARQGTGTTGGGTTGPPGGPNTQTPDPPPTPTPTTTPPPPPPPPPTTTPPPDPQTTPSTTASQSTSSSVSSVTTTLPTSLVPLTPTGISTIAAVQTTARAPTFATAVNNRTIVDPLPTDAPSTGGSNPSSFFQNTSAVVGVFSFAGIMILVIIGGIVLSCVKRIRRQKREAREEEDFVIGESASSRNGHTGGSMRSVASNVGPLVTDRGTGFAMAGPDNLARQQSHGSFGYDPYNRNPFEAARTPGGAVPPSVAMAAAARGYSNQEYPGQEYSYPTHRQPAYPQGHPYQADEYADHQPYPTQYSGYQHQYNTHAYPNLPASSQPAGAARPGQPDPFDDQGAKAY